MLLDSYYFFIICLDAAEVCQLKMMLCFQGEVESFWLACSFISNSLVGGGYWCCSRASGTKTWQSDMWCVSLPLLHPAPQKPQNKPKTKIILHHKIQKSLSFFVLHSCRLNISWWYCWIFFLCGPLRLIIANKYKEWQSLISDRLPSPHLILKSIDCTLPLQFYPQFSYFQAYYLVFKNVTVLQPFLHWKQ